MLNKIILLLSLLAVFIFIISYYRKWRWEKLILKRQIVLGTVNIDESKGAQFKLGSLSTLSILLLVAVSIPNQLSSILEKSYLTGLDDEVQETVNIYDTVTKDVVYKMTLRQVMHTNSLEHVVYGKVIDEEKTDEFTFVFLEIIDGISDKQIIKIYQTNSDNILVRDESYIMFLKYSENLDYYSIIAENTAYLIQNDNRFTPSTELMFYDLSEEDLELPNLLDYVFSN